MALPLGKLGDLVLKTLSKPLAKAIKRRAASHPKFRASIANWAQVRARAGAPRVGGTHKVRAQPPRIGSAVPHIGCAHCYPKSHAIPFHRQLTACGCAQGLADGRRWGYHRFTVRLQRRLYGQAPAGHIKRLNEEKAVSTASEVVGELIVFAVAGGVVFIEAARSARSNARKEAKLKQEREALHEGDRQLEEEARRLRERVEQLEEALAADVWLPRVLTGLATGSTSASSSSSASNSSSSGSSSGSSVPTPPAAVGGTREGEAEGRGVESREGGESEGYGVEEEQGEGSGAGGSRREGGEGPGEGQEKGGWAGVGVRVRRWMGGWMGGWGGGSKHAPGAAAGDGVVRIHDMEGGDGTGEEGGGGEEEGAVELKMSASR
ncbi:unnamed protein product [Closterium sp. NIES-64]|nr:unnamed protein product [Closterium sp. NIES-64]